MNLDISVIDNSVVVRKNGFIDLYFPFIIPFRPLKLNVADPERLKHLRFSTKAKMVQENNMPLLINHLEKEETLKHMSVQHYVNFITSMIAQNISVRIIKKKNRFMIVGIHHERFPELIDHREMQNRILNLKSDYRSFPEIRFLSKTISIVGKFPFFSFKPELAFQYNKKWTIPVSSYGSILDRIIAEFKSPEDLDENAISTHAVGDFEGNELSAYVFSVSDRKYQLEEGQTLLVYGPSYELGEWFPQVLGTFRDRLLWLGNFPSECGREHSVDFQKFRVDFLSLLHSNQIGSDPTIIGEWLSKILKVKSFRKAFWKLVNMIRQKGLGQGLNNVPFSKIIEAFGHPDVSQSMTEHERWTIYTTFLQIADYQLLDGETPEHPLVYNEFGYLWHSLNNQNVIQMLFEAFVLLKYGSLHQMDYSLLVVENQEASLHLLTTGALQSIQSEFPHLKIILCLRQCTRLSQMHHELIIGKHQVAKFLKFEKVMKFTKTINLFHQPGRTKLTEVKIDNFGEYFFENEFEQGLLEEADPPRQTSVNLGSSNAGVELIMKKLTPTGKVKPISTPDYIELIKERVGLCQLLERFPLIRRIRGFSLTENMTPSLIRLRRIDLDRLHENNVELAVKNGFILSIGKGYSKETEEFELTSKGIGWYTTQIKRIKQDFVDLVQTLPYTFDHFKETEQKLKELVDLRQVSVSRLVNLKLIEYGFIAFAFGNAQQSIPGILIALYSVFDNENEFSDAVAISDEIDSNYRLTCVSLKSKVLELITQTEEKTKLEEIVEDPSIIKDVDDIDSGLLKSSPEEIPHLSPSLPEIMEFMRDNRLTSVLLAEEDKMSAEQKYAAFISIPVKGFFNETTARKLGSFKNVKLKKLLSISIDEIKLEINDQPILEKIQQLRSLASNHKFNELFSYLSQYYKKVILAMGLKAPKAILPPDVVIPLSKSDKEHILESIMKSRSNFEAFGKFFLAILQVWAQNEQLRKRPSKEKDKLVEWINKVDSVKEVNFTNETIAVLNRLVQSYQEMRGGMQIKFPEDGTPKYNLVATTQFRLNKLWVLIDDDLNRNKSFLIKIVPTIAGFRS